MINNPKISNTCLRVFEVIKLLIQKPYSIEELINILSEKENNQNIYTQETIIKYITTLRVMGLDISKEKRKFVLKKYPIDLNLNEKELKTLEKIENYIVNKVVAPILKNLSARLKNVLTERLQTIIIQIFLFCLKKKASTT